MKKLLSIILISVMFLSMFAINTSADEELTKDEATQLAFEAYRAITSFNEYAYHDTLEGKMYDKASLTIVALNSFEGANYDDAKYFETFTSTSGGVSYPASQLGKTDEYKYYRFVTSAQTRGSEFEKKWNETGDSFYKLDTKFTRSFNTLDDVKSYLGEIFTSEESEKSLYSSQYTDINGAKVELFRTSKDGNLLLLQPIATSEETPVFCIQEINDLKVNGNKAVLNIKLRHHVHFTIKVMAETVEFSKTEKGWRISGGSAINILRGEVDMDKWNIVKTYGPPSTSDSTPLYIAAIALVSLAAPVVMKRRRREF